MLLFMLLTFDLRSHWLFIHKGRTLQASTNWLVLFATIALRDNINEYKLRNTIRNTLSR